jgi:uncharacterized protein YyaL (SSP411 family)
MSSEFHFSPRPNRAAEIRWREWNAETFADAQQQEKPILLAISAVWCHWCHVMDETSYSDPGIIEAINRRYVPVRVDNDRRPDVNARYNRGGWPTTAFLSPDGSLLAGATYLPPSEMRAALDQIADFYELNREAIAKRTAELRASTTAAQEPQTPESLDARPIDAVLAAIEASFDEEYGGFGNAPKFPMVDVLELLFEEHAVRGDERLYEMAARTLLAMSRGGMYDHVEGGFFRYSTTRDWSVPHFEKMAEDHAGLLRVLSHAVRTTRNAQFRETLVSALGYVRRTLRDPQLQLFGGSQDADEEYYALPLEERRAREAPYVDRTSYSNWTAAMAGAWALAGRALDDDDLIAESGGTLDALHEKLRDDAALLYHYLEPGSQPAVRGLLTDQAAYLRALLDAYDVTAEPRFVQRAKETAGAVNAHFSAPDGGFYDHAALEAQLGTLPLRDRPINDNSLMAENLVRLAAVTGEERYRQLAADALRLYATHASRTGLFAAPYARALRRLLPA